MLRAHCSPWTDSFGGRKQNVVFVWNFSQFRQRPTHNPIAHGEGLFEVADAFAYLESVGTPSTNNESDGQYVEFELHMPIRSCATRRMDKSAFGDPQSRGRTFVDLFVEDFVADEKQCTTQLLIWRRRAHEFQTSALHLPC